MHYPMCHPKVLPVFNELGVIRQLRIVGKASSIGYILRCMIELFADQQM